MEINIIKTEKEYEKALKEIDNLLDAKENSSEAEKLEILSMLVEDYENKHYKIEAPDPIEAINFRVEQLGLSRKDLERVQVQEVKYLKFLIKEDCLLYL